MSEQVKRWNFEEADGRLQVCKGDHDKSHGCEFEPLTLADVKLMHKRIAELEFLTNKIELDLTYTEVKELYKKAEFMAKSNLLPDEVRTQVKVWLDARRLKGAQQRIADLERSLATERETFERLRNMLQQKACRLETQNALLRAVAEAAAAYLDCIVNLARNPSSETTNAAHEALCKWESSVKAYHASIDGSGLEAS